MFFIETCSDFCMKYFFYFNAMKITSRGKSIYITMEFELHREGNLSTSRRNFWVIYLPEIDGIPSFRLHPTVKRLMIGYKF